MHLVLLGDSILDNAAYTRGGPDVVAQVRRHAPAGWSVTLAAVDGDVARDVEAQLRRVPPDAGFLVVSAGGNDALGHVHFLAERAGSVAEVVGRLAGMMEAFERDYLRMLDALRARGVPVAVCTIYYPRFPDATEQRLASAALSVYNDVILRAAFGAGLPVIDLRRVCGEDADYANPIEPSSHGGDKIARAIVRLVSEWAPERGRTEVYVG